MLLAGLRDGGCAPYRGEVLPGGGGMSAPTRVRTAAAEWSDGLRVCRMVVEGSNIWLEIVWQGKPVEVRIGRQALHASRPKRAPLPLGDMT